MGGGERAIRQQPGVENRGFHPFRAGHHSVLDVPGDDGRHVHERARPGVQDRPFLAVGSDIGQAARSPKGYSRNRAIPYSKRRWCAAWGRRAGRRGAAPVPTAYSNRLRAKTSSIWPARDSWTPSPPPETASGKMCRNSDASAILLRILRRSIFVRYRRIVIRIEWARCTAAPCSASYGWHQKMAGGTEGRVGAACAEKGTEGEVTAATSRQAVPWRHG